EWFGHPDRVTIPLDQLAKLEAGQSFAAALDEAVEVADHEVDAFLERRVRSNASVRRPVGELPEEEWVRQGASADRDRGAARLLKRGGRIMHGPNVLVAYDGDPLDRLDDRADAHSVHVPAETLGASAAMDDHARNPNFFKLPGKGRGRERL